MNSHEQTTQIHVASAGFRSEKLRGVLLPFPTPFDAMERLDVQALVSNIGRWNETGIAGYVALGSTGEPSHLSEEERREVMLAARAAVPANKFFIAGTGNQSTRQTIRETERAAVCGADAVLVITPHFYRGAMTQEALSNHYTTLADHSPVPVLLYQIPQNTAVRFEVETIKCLAEHERIVGIKDSSGEVEFIAGVARASDADFATVTGHAGTFFDALAHGARGGILALACLVPEVAVEIHRLATETAGAARASELQTAFGQLATAVTTRYGIGGLKAALDMRGYTGGAVRSPLAMPLRAAHDEIARALDECLRCFDAEVAIR